MANNILIIGNGFDVYHGFPTKYTDFLNFVVSCYNYHEMNKDAFFNMGDNKVAIRLKELMDLDAEKILNPEKSFIEISENNKYILTAYNDNFWIKYFLAVENSLSDNWIDFEKEIGNVLSVIKDFFEGKFSNYTEEASSTPNDTLYKPFFDAFDLMNKDALLAKEVEDLSDFRIKSLLRNRYADKTKIDRLENRILDYIREELVELKKYMNFYMKTVVSSLETRVCSEQLQSLESVNLLSFNYTNFYSKIYNNQRIDGIHYIHGNICDSDIVLGTDRGCSSKEEAGYLYFEKYFQRLQNKTGFRYREWIQKNDFLDNEPSNVIVLGHSLDPVDMDLLKRFFDVNNNVEKIIIFYYCQRDYEEKIINLIDTFRKDTLEDLMGTDRVVFEEWNAAVEKDF